MAHAKNTHIGNCGKTKYFFPKVKKEDVVVQETRDFLQRIYDGSIGMMMSALLRQNDLSKEDIQELREILEAAEKKETAETEKKQYTDKNTLDSNVEKKHLESQNQNQSQNQGASASISNGDYILPEIASRYYTETELSGMDAHTLSLARNELYARHGYIFKKTELQEYFGAKQWYTPQVAEVPDSSFNQYEKANLELIQNLEARY